MITKLRETLTIGALARKTGCKAETIRYYERIGLLPPPPRTEGRQRIYDDSHRRRLTFIRRSRALGFSLDEVRTLLALADRGPSCAEVRAVADAHLADVRGKLADLQRMERTLAATVARCTGDEAPDCPILDALSG